MEPTANGSFIQEALALFRELQQNPLFNRVFTVLVYAVLAKAADLFMDRLIRRLTARTSITTDDRLIDFLHKPVCFSIFLFGLLHAVHLPPDLGIPWTTVLPNLIQTLLLIVWWAAIIREINRMNKFSMADFLEKRGIDKDLFLLIKNIGQVLIIFAGIAWGLLIWNIDLTPLFASAGIAGIAIALAAKDTMANFIGGISLFADRAYKVGDYIIIDNNQRGEVVDMGIRSTRIKTRDDVMISIPNSIMAVSTIVNESAPEPRFRIRIDVGVAYGSDLRKVEKILLRVADENDTIVKKPEPRVRLRAFADSSVNFQLLVWVGDPSEKGLQTHNLLKAIYVAFAEEGITIPFPQRDVHMYPQQNGE